MLFLKMAITDLRKRRVTDRANALSGNAAKSGRKPAGTHRK